MPKIKKLPASINFVDKALLILKTLRENQLINLQSCFWQELQKRHLKLKADASLVPELKGLLDNTFVADLDRAELFVNHLPLLQGLLPKNEIHDYFKHLQTMEWQGTIPPESLPIFLELMLADQSISMATWQCWFQSLQTLAEPVRDASLFNMAWKKLAKHLNQPAVDAGQSQALAATWTLAVQLLPSNFEEDLYLPLAHFATFLDIFVHEKDQGQKTC